MSTRLGHMDIDIEGSNGEEENLKMPKASEEREINQVSAHEAPTHAKMDCEKIVWGVMTQIGFDPYDRELPSVDNKGLGDKTGEVLVRIDKLDPDSAGGGYIGNAGVNVGVGNHGIMLCYARNGRKQFMPPMHSVAKGFGATLTEVHTYSRAFAESLVKAPSMNKKIQALK